MATFVLKVNASSVCSAFPTHPVDWDRKQFFSPASRSIVGSEEQPPMPEKGDRVHVWINERGGGGGYTGYGTVLHCFGHFSHNKHPRYEFRLKNPKLLPKPLKGECFWKYEAEAEAIFSIRRYTLRQLLWMDDTQAADFELALRKVAVGNFGPPMEQFI